MTTRVLPPRASWRIAFRAQFDLLRASRRPVIAVGLMLFMWAVIEYASVKAGFWSTLGRAHVFNAAWIVLHGLLGCGWALAVWRDTQRSTRTIHWSMPVDVTAHDIARLAAGIAWLTMLTAVSVAALLVLASLHGFTGDVFSSPPVFWLAHFAAAWIGYLLVAPLSTISGRPAEIILLTYIGVSGGLALLSLHGDSKLFDRFARMMEVIFFGKYGLATAFFGGKDLDGQWTSSLALPDGFAVTWIASALLWTAIGLLTLGCALAFVRRRLVQ